eukprot:jgi/Chrpa1/14660/Chrysochromulina_OHIO_Genome00005064-RA
MRGDNDALIRLIAAGGDIEHKGSYGQTPLMSAAVNGHLPCVETLLGSRAQVDATNNVGYTALHWSAINNHPDVVRRLLASGANRTARDKLGKSALDIAREKRHAAVVALLEAPAVWDAASDGNNDELRKLIADGGDVNWKNPYWYEDTALMAAGGHLACVETLLEARALVDATNVVGRTALHLAARMNHPEIVRRLLDAGADRSIRCKVGKTALDEARQKGHAAVVAILDPTSTPVPPPVPPPVLPAASPALPPSATKRNRSALEALSDLFSPAASGPLA